MRVRLGAILLKDPVITKNLIAILQCNGKHCFYINIMIDRSFIEDYQEHYVAGTVAQLNHCFLWELSSFLDATLLISVSTIDCPHSFVLRIRRHHRRQNTSHPKREYSRYLLFGNLFEANLQTFSV